MKTIVIICMVSLLTINLAAQQTFKPWGADVVVGDEACPLHTAGECHGSGSRAGAEGITMGVYDAFTGGAVLLIRVFQIWISPQDGPTCRLRPTCSAYGKIAVQKHGAFLGGLLAGDRILRCNMFSSPGDDPVPDVIFNK
jgi:uncharacterized protein